MLTRAEGELAALDKAQFAHALHTLGGRIFSMRKDITDTLRAALVSRARPIFPGVSDSTLESVADKSDTLRDESDRQSGLVATPNEIKDAARYFATYHAGVIAELQATAARLDLVRAYAADTSAPLPAAELAAHNCGPRRATKKLDPSFVPPPSRSHLIAEGANLIALGRMHAGNPNVRQVPEKERRDEINAKLKANGYAPADAAEVEPVVSALLTSAGFRAAA